MKALELTEEQYKWMHFVLEITDDLVAGKDSEYTKEDIAIHDECRELFGWTAEGWK